MFCAHAYSTAYNHLQADELLERRALCSRMEGELLRRRHEEIEARGLEARGQIAADAAGLMR